MKASFQLTMPNVGSWNGKWTGAEKKYFVIKPLGRKKIDQKRFFDLLDGRPSRGFYYNFGDGWGANVSMEIVDDKEANKRKKQSAGFCGYEWMIESIIKNGKILAD